VGKGNPMLAIEIVSSVVGPTVDDAIRHGLKIAIVACFAVFKKPAAYSTHGNFELRTSNCGSISGFPSTFGMPLHLQSTRLQT
jgi:hypothetical protein